jgi:hypothetical protein
MATLAEIHEARHTVQDLHQRKSVLSIFQLMETKIQQALLGADTESQPLIRARVKLHEQV